jgi:hypothetical protein
MPSQLNSQDNQRIEYLSYLIDSKKNLLQNKFNNSLEDINNFKLFLNNKKYVNISKVLNDSLSFHINPITKVKSDESLNESRTGSINRRTQNVSLSSNSFNYHIGSSSSTKIGDDTSLTKLADNEKKSSIQTGRNVSIAIGDSNSDTTISSYNKTKQNGDESSINIIEGEIKSNTNITGCEAYTDIVANSFHKISATYSHHTNITGISADFTYMPFKGHFTVTQQIMCGLYGDLAETENLYFIFNHAHNMFDLNITKAETENTLASNLTDLFVQDESIIRIRDTIATTEQNAISNRASSVAMTTSQMMMNNSLLIY